MTPEALVLGRRAALAGAGSMALAAPALAQTPPDRRATRNTSPGRDITPEKYATTYNNYYEFSEGKNLWEAAQVLKPRPVDDQSGGHAQAAAHHRRSTTC